MKTHNIDSEIKNLIDGSADFFDAEAEDSKEKIWQHVQLKEQKLHNHLFWYHALAAACIVFFLTTSVLLVLKIKADKELKTLAGLNSRLQEQINTNSERFTALNELTPTAHAVPDTVYIEKIVPVSTTNTVVKTDRVVDTLYIERKIYVEKEQPPQTVAELDTQPDAAPQLTSGTETQILIRNNGQAVPKKENKLRIRIGGTKNPSKEGSLALTTKL